MDGLKKQLQINYDTFWNDFGKNIKHGIIKDATNQ